MARRNTNPLLAVAILIALFIAVVQQIMTFFQENPEYLILMLLSIGLVFYLQKMKKRKASEENEAKLTQFKDEFIRYGLLYENGPLPVIESDLILKKHEELHSKILNIKWCEFRKVTNKVTYDGFSYRIPIAGGLSYRMGSVGVNRQSVDRLQQLSFGDLYVTNKAFFFRSPIGNKTLNYRDIANIIPTLEGIIMERDSGKNIFLLGHVPPESAAVIVWVWFKSRG